MAVTNHAALLPKNALALTRTHSLLFLFLFLFLWPLTRTHSASPGTHSQGSLWLLALVTGTDQSIVNDYVGRHALPLRCLKGCPPPAAPGALEPLGRWAIKGVR